RSREDRMIGDCARFGRPLIDTPWRAIEAAQIEPAAHGDHFEQPAQPIQRGHSTSPVHETNEHINDLIEYSKSHLRLIQVTPQSLLNPTGRSATMSRLSVPNLDSATGATAEIYGQIKKAVGNVPNTFAAIGAHGPAALKAVLAADAVLASGSLSKRDQET